MTAPTSILRDGLHFGEGPRWHDGRFWYSDFYDHAVHAIDLEGTDERVVEVPGQPSGLGWLPDGDLLVVSMRDLRVLRWDGTSLAEHADLSNRAGFLANDMVVDGRGGAYVGSFGFDVHRVVREQGAAAAMGDSAPTTTLCRVDPDGRVHTAASGMAFPNGSVITPDGSTLIVAETTQLRLTAFTIGPDGSLSDRRVWADLSPHLVAPDGICLDAEGAVWSATVVSPQLVRIAEGGEIIDRVTTTMPTFACMLGGPERRHLIAMTAPSSDDVDRAAGRDGCIELAEVEVPGAGLP